MIMRITWGKVHPGTWAKYEQAYEEAVNPRAKDFKGLRGRWLVQDVDDRDAGFAVSLWESSEDLRAYEQGAAYQQIVAALQPYFVGDFRTNHCEVKVSQDFV